MSDSRTVHVVELRHNKQLRAVLSAYEGELFASLRVFSLPDESATWVASARGITLPVAQLAELEAAVRALREAVDRMPATSEPKRKHGPLPQFVPRRAP